LDNKTLIVLVDKLIEDAIKNLVLPEATRGPRGLKGKDGNDFSLEEHQEKIVSFIQENIPTKIELTEDQIQSLKGSDGLNGRDGKDGKSVYVEDLIPLVTESIENKFSSVKDSLKLKFEDLTEEQIFSLKGKKGKDGKDGQDFDFQEHSKEIQNQIITYIDSVRDCLKLYFQDLTVEEKDSLKLKFTDLTDEEKESLKGKRGQRGKSGVDGKDGYSAYELSNFEGSLEEWISSLKGERGSDGARGPIGLTGLVGPRGFEGRDGVDGNDAPVIVDAELNEGVGEFSITLKMSDGTEIESNSISLPVKPVNVYNSYLSMGGGTSGGSQLIVLDEGVEVATTNKMNFVGDSVEVTQVGDTTVVNFGGSSVSNIRQQILDSEDRVQDISYSDFGTRNERITRIDYYSPSIIDTIARKDFTYVLDGTNYKRTNITWTIVTL